MVANNLRPCRNCHHDRARHVFENDDWDCIDCDCHYFQGVAKKQATGFLNKDKEVTLTQTERAILLHLIRTSDMRADLDDLEDKLR